MGHEVGHGHHPAAEEGGDPGQETEDEHRSADEFDDAGEPHERERVLRLAPQDAEDLLHPVAGEEEAGHDPEGGVGVVPERVENGLHDPASFDRGRVVVEAVREIFAGPKAAFRVRGLPGNW